MLYVEELIGPNTVNTVPPATLDAFRDHGKPRDSLEENVEDARHVLAELEKSGISLDAITAELVKDGVKQFADAADKLYGAVAHKRAAVLGAGIDAQKLALGAGIDKAVEKSTEEWRASAKIRRLWHKDKSVWTGDDENKWLGWLDQRRPSADVADYEDYAQRVKGQNFSDAVVLGMGGSSLGPEVLAETFPKKSGFPKLHVLDSTDPAQVRAMEAGGRSQEDAVHRLQQVRRHHRAERDEGLFLRAVVQGDRRGQGRPSLHRRDRSRLVAGEGRDQTGLCAHLPRRSRDRRALFRAVAVRPGAGGDRRHRRAEPDPAYAVDGALLRRGRAAA